MALILASKSPRRQELMRLVVSTFEVDVPVNQEEAPDGLSPAVLAQRLALAKAQEVGGRRPSDTVIGCDTVVEAAGQVFGKPGSRRQAMAMLQTLSDARHFVHTGVCILLPGKAEPTALFTQSSAVDFGPVPPGEIVSYVKTDEPYDKAGGYGIQGWAARHIIGIEGCFYNVMGLPVAALYRELHRLGLA